MRARLAVTLVCMFVTGASLGARAGSSFDFVSIEGEPLPMAAWRGQPVLVVNTASMCAFTRQYDDLQALYDAYRARGLVVLAVPSDDFRQELASGEKVREFCALNFDLTLPMTDITHVKGEQAHPFYKWLSAEHGFTPGWNFNKVLIGPKGEVLATWGSMVAPTSKKITGAIEAVLPR